MLISGSEFNKKNTYGHIHTYGHMYSLLHLSINRVQNPYTKLKTLQLINSNWDTLQLNHHNPTKPIPNTGFWFAPFNFNTLDGDWLAHVKRETAKELGIDVKDINQENLMRILQDSLYRLNLGDNVRVLYLNSKKTIKDMFRQPDNTYYIDWEDLAKDYDVVYLTKIVTDFLTQQGYKGFEMEQGVILGDCDLSLEPVLSKYADLPSTTPRGLFKKSILVEHYSFLEDIHLLEPLSDDDLIMVVEDFESLAEVFDYTTGEFYFRGQNYIYIPYRYFRDMLKMQSDFKFPSKTLLSSQDVLFNIL